MNCKGIRGGKDGDDDKIDRDSALRRENVDLSNGKISDIVSFVKKSIEEAGEDDRKVTGGGSPTMCPCPE
ncbi:hypothetical protein MTR_7g109890 [Medicago truncatula]|uniref:Uncharacterized protein n=1 Tax=Medicago truncatula TaxID=3880 RepID=G7KTP1_MEDTR|nr:hypothetical protein MTR_7g109890 [Medicago truncatula]